MRLAILLAVITACGYPPLEGSAGTDAKVDDPHVDAPIHPGDGPVDLCAPTTYGSPTLTAQVSDFFPATGQNDPDQLTYEGQLTTASSPDILGIALIDGAGPFTNGIAPKTIQLAGDELNWASCNACVFIAARCNNCDFTLATGASYYMATGGTLRITAVDPTIKGTLTNVTLTHVVVDSVGSNPSFISTPVGDCNTQIVSTSFTATVTVH